MKLHDYSIDLSLSTCHLNVAFLHIAQHKSDFEGIQENICGEEINSEIR